MTHIIIYTCDRNPSRVLLRLLYSIFNEFNYTYRKVFVVDSTTRLSTIDMVYCLLHYSNSRYTRSSLHLLQLVCAIFFYTALFKTADIHLLRRVSIHPRRNECFSTIFLVIFFFFFVE